MERLSKVVSSARYSYTCRQNRMRLTEARSANSLSTVTFNDRALVQP